LWATLAYKKRKGTQCRHSTTNSNIGLVKRSEKKDARKKAKRARNSGVGYTKEVQRITPTRNTAGKAILVKQSNTLETMRERHVKQIATEWWGGEQDLTNQKESKGYILSQAKGKEQNHA